jgi:hypothetical protein
VKLSDGRRLGALEIQESYLAECEQALQSSDWPAWCFDLLRHWRGTVEALRKDPLLLADRLDTSCKLLIYSHEIERAGHDWVELRDALHVLDKLHTSYTEAMVQAVLADDVGGCPKNAESDFRRVAAEVRSGGKRQLDRLRLALRLQAFDLRYHEVGGPFDALASAAAARMGMATAAEVELASREPPPDGRAACRSRAIQASQEPGWACDWQFAIHVPSGHVIDMRDPFASQSQTLETAPTARADAKTNAELLNLIDVAQEGSVFRSRSVRT